MFCFLFSFGCHKTPNETITQSYMRKKMQKNTTSGTVREKKADVCKKFWVNFFLVIFAWTQHKICMREIKSVG